MNLKSFTLLALYLWAQTAINFIAVQAQPLTTPQAAKAAPALVEANNINAWLMRLHETSKQRSYIGTYVVSSGGQMQSAKIWHVYEGAHQVERVDSLTGAPRSTFRHNDKVVTFMPDRKIVRNEKRETAASFPQLVQSADNRIAEFYKLKTEGVERVAGLESDVVLLVPRDALRFGYRVWTEQKKGLIVKLQTLDSEGRVLEQAAFSELQLDAPVKMEKLMHMMGKVDGYRVEQHTRVKTTASAQGWKLAMPVPGFTPMNCYKRPPTGASGATAADDTMQWIFSDGLTSVSLFVEPFDRQKHAKASASAVGATHTITRQLGSYWLTALGEVPMSTLKQFASGLERKK